MSSTMRLEIVSSEGKIFSGQVAFTVVPGEGGDLGIYPRHAPLLTRMRPGSVRFKTAENSAEELIYVSGGILEIQPDQITVLSDTAIRGKDLDGARANAAIEAAKSALSDKQGALEYAQAQVELAQAMAQLAALRKLKAIK
jgi:F-type H+-transporting ATPase subunit epsilon